MKRTLFDSEKKILETLVPADSRIMHVIHAIIQARGTVFLVGGVVRDLLLQLSSKDLDFEVHNLSLETLTNILEQYGVVNFVGKSFGVLKFRCSDCVADIDFSLPRTDSNGRKPDVHIDPAMGIEQALRRRDLTMNAMAINMSTYELYDPFGGEQDLKNKLLRCPDEQLFVEDPLRFFRVMQFIGRFGFSPDEQLNHICKTMDLDTISRERIEEELKKLLLKSERPSLGFRWIAKLGRLQELFPELAALVGVPQSKQWHPEGDVFEHTMQALDAAADICRRCNDTQMNEEERLILMYAALCHDLGKAKTTVVHEDTPLIFPLRQGYGGQASELKTPLISSVRRSDAKTDVSRDEAGPKITSYRHEEVGYDLAYDLMKRFCGDKSIIKAVRKLVRYHMDPGNFLKNNARVSAYKKLALKLAPETNCYMLALLMEADKRGRNGESHIPLPGPTEQAELFLEKVTKAGVMVQPEPPVLTGADLLEYVEPGPKLGELVKKAYEMQIDESISDKEILKKRVLKI